MKNNDPVYPINPVLEFQLHPDKDAVTEKRLGFFGLTKRELLVAMAMQGFVANTSHSQEGYDRIAKWAVSQADAIIEALEKE